MPTFEFTSPDGRTFEVDGPDGATPEQAFSVLQTQMKAAPSAPAPANAAPDERALGVAPGIDDAAAIYAPAPKRQSVLDGVTLPPPTITPGQEQENDLLSQRAYAERTPDVNDPRNFAPSMTAMPPRSSAPSGPAKRDVGFWESAGRNYGRAGAEVAELPSLALAVSGVVWDKLHSVFSGSGQSETGAQDWMFRNLVDPRQQAVDWYALKPDEQETFLGKIGGSLGGMLQDLPLMFASGGLSKETQLAQQAPTVARFLEDVTSKGFDAMRPIMVKAGTDKARQVLDAGGTPLQAVNSATATALWTGFSGAQPMSAAGSIPRRIATGVPVGMVQEEAGRSIQNAADPAALQRPFDPAEMLAGGVTNAIAAGVLGHREPGRMADRIDLGYDPLTGKTPVADAVQGMGEPPARLAPGRAQPARDPVADLFSAGSVEEAAASALNLAEAPRAGGTSVADEIRSIRPARPVELNPPEGNLDERPAAEVPALAAGPGGPGGADAGTGVDVRAGDHAVPELPLEPGRQGAQATAGAAPVGDAARPAAVDTAASRYAFERTPSGSLIVRGDQAGIREALANLPPDVMVPTRDGIQVATNWSDKAATLLHDFDPTAYQDLNGKKVSIRVEAEDGTHATLKLDAGRALRATDARERELERLRECVGRAA